MKNYKCLENSDQNQASADNCLKLEKLDRKLSNVANLSLADEEFIDNVGADIDLFLKQRHNASVLLFPPVNNFRRFLIHQTCENFRQKYDLFTFSVGQGPFRRTVVCFKNQLLDPSKFTDSAATANFESRKKAPVKSWRSERRIEPTHENLTTSSSIARREKDLSTGKMGVEKFLSDARSTKTTSADLYRPPALRNNSVEMLDTKPGVGAINAAGTLNAPPTSSPPSSPSVSTEAATITTTTSISCNSSPIHANENTNFEKSLTSPCGARAAATETSATAASAQQRQQQQAARRERRPDRAVYIPRARRSQTTPPTATTTTVPAMATIATPAAASTTASCNNASSSKQPQQQLPITPQSTAAVCIAPPLKTDESVSKSLSKKSKSLGSRERKERAKKSGTDAQAAKISKLSGKPQIEDTTGVDVKESQDDENKSKITILNCDNVQPEQQEQNEEIPSSTAIIISAITSDTETKKSPTEHLQNLMLCTIEAEQISAEITTANQMNATNSGRNNHVEMSNLRIEDVTSKENARNTAKCDIEEQEFQRASKEINRSNRRIIKQTFISDVLEIPDKINTSVEEECVPAATNLPLSSSVATNSAVDSTTEEEEEDDWETMFDDTGECLDPKIMEELTASVGKVKIELPKMDYSAYLTKQSILNEEEFPHVLEVSNFPVEFKNQDLLMVFSQYKESGFDIKWVDDTHALAVFSCSRIAAEVLTMGHPFVVLKPLAEATIESRLKAKKCAASLQPYRQRPETCAALARRLVTGALGVRLKTAAAERENEKRVLREAKERKLLAAKQRDEAWES